MTAGRGVPARPRTITARILQRPGHTSSLFAGQDPPTAAEPVGEATTTTRDFVDTDGAGAEEEKKPLTEFELAQMEKRAEIERLRSKEKFITVKTGAACKVRSIVPRRCNG